MDTRGVLVRDPAQRGTAVGGLGTVRGQRLRKVLGVRGAWLGAGVHRHGKKGSLGTQLGGLRGPPAETGAGGSWRGRGQGVNWDPGDAWRASRARLCGVPSLATPEGPASGLRRGPHPAGCRRRGGGCARRRRESGLGCSRAAGLALRRERRQRGRHRRQPCALPARRPACSPHRGWAAGSRSRRSDSGPAGRWKDARTERRGRALPPKSRP